MTQGVALSVVYHDEKQRFKVVYHGADYFIRANQGHTLRELIDETLLFAKLESQGEILGEAVHGTYAVHWPSIKRVGLWKVDRDHIHMAQGVLEAGGIIQGSYDVGGREMSTLAAGITTAILLKNMLSNGSRCNPLRIHVLLWSSGRGVVVNEQECCCREYDRVPENY